jgi:hypothetical protein
MLRHVPSELPSSTRMISNGTPMGCAHFSTALTKAAMLPSSLYIGATMESTGLELESVICPGSTPD